MRTKPIPQTNGQTCRPRSIQNYVFLLGMFMCLAVHVVLYYFAQAATELWADYNLKLSLLSQAMLSYGDWLKTGFDFFPPIPRIIPIMGVTVVSSLTMIVIFRDKTTLHLTFRLYVTAIQNTG